MNMSKRLTEEEIRQNRLQREERQREKDMEFKLDERSYTILRTLRDASKHSDIKYNSKYFAKLFKVSEPTIFRIIQGLREKGILEEKLVNGSYVINSNFEDLYYSGDTQKNIALIASLSGLLQQFEGTPLFDSITKLIYFLQPEVAKKDAVLSSGRIIVAPQMKYDINVKDWNKVYESIQKNHKLQFRYLKPYTNNEAERIIWPLQLILDNGSVYLFAYSEYADLVLLYDLNYMTDIVVLDENFELPEKYDINNYSGGTRLGAYTGDTVENYKIRFTDYAKEWMKNHKFAEDQSFTDENDSTVISFSSSQYHKVLQLILSWGHQAEPLAPDRLVKQWKEEVIAMAKKVKGKHSPV